MIPTDTLSGVMAHVLRLDLPDMSHDGVTSPDRARGKRIILFSETVRSTWWDVDECLADPKVICLKIARSDYGQTVRAVPMGPAPEGCVGPLFGGNYLTGLDPSFHDIWAYPVPVYDRYEESD